MEIVTSDLHIGHANIIRFCNRPFEDLNDMHESIMQKYDSMPDTADTVIWNLGDVWFGKNLRNASFDVLREDVKRMRGKHRRLKLILGNHDFQILKYMPVASKGFNSVKFFFEAVGFDDVYDHPILVDNRFILSHEPVPLSINSNLRNIHGHTHDKPVDRLYFVQDGEGPIVDPNFYANACWDFNNLLIYYDLDSLKERLTQYDREKSIYTTSAVL